jgi:hypothetical protein
MLWYLKKRNFIVDRLVKLKEIVSECSGCLVLHFCCVHYMKLGNRTLEMAFDELKEQPFFVDPYGFGTEQMDNKNGVAVVGMLNSLRRFKRNMLVVSHPDRIKICGSCLENVSSVLVFVDAILDLEDEDRLRAERQQQQQEESAKEREEKSNKRCREVFSDSEDEEDFVKPKKQRRKKKDPKTVPQFTPDQFEDLKSLCDYELKNFEKKPFEKLLGHWYSLVKTIDTLEGPAESTKKTVNKYAPVVVNTFYYACKDETRKNIIQATEDDAVDLIMEAINYQRRYLGGCNFQKNTKKNVRSCARYFVKHVLQK